MFKNALITLLAVLAFWPATITAQQESSFARAAQDVETRLAESIAELNAVREQAAQETIPLSRRLSELESELGEVRTEYRSAVRLLDTRTLDITNLQNEIKGREQQAAYLSNLLSEYGRRFESRLHIAEVARYAEVLKQAAEATENETLEPGEVYARQAALLDAAVERLFDALGGTKFTGRAVDVEGTISQGEFVMVGPSVVFRSDDGSRVGSAEQRLGSLEPAIIPFGSGEDALAAAALPGTLAGVMPIDATLGSAHKIEQTEETFLEHVAKGGPVMIPIFVLAGAAFLVVMIKWLGFLRVRHPSPRQVRDLLNAVARHDRAHLNKLSEAICKPNVTRDWQAGALVGAIAGGLVGWALTTESAAPLIDLVPQFAGVLQAGPLVHMVAFGLFGALVQLMLRNWFGHSPVGEMLAAGIEHIEEPPELIEEIMYEKVLSVRLRLERFLPFVAVSAASAPLLGLLGTVTGIINTFKLITVFGSGDVKMLSSGISEALVTTEFGLIVAIPSLLLHALLARQVRSVINEMEQGAVALLNQVGKTPFREGLVTKITRKLDISADKDDEPIAAGAEVLSNNA